MKQFNELAKKISDLHSKGEQPVKSMTDSMSDASSEDPSLEDMHAELAEHLDPDTHAKVKEIVGRHLASNDKAPPSSAPSMPGSARESLEKAFKVKESQKGKKAFGSSA